MGEKQVTGAFITGCSWHLIDVDIEQNEVDNNQQQSSQDGTVSHSNANLQELPLTIGCGRRKRIKY